MPNPTFGTHIKTVESIGLAKLICRRGDSNPHELPHTPLKRARLPVPPLRLVWAGCQKTKARHFFAGEGEALAPGCVAAGVAAAGVACGVGTGVGVAAGA